MKTKTSTIDSDYKLLTYSNGVQYIVYHSASWLVGADDEIGNALKEKYFPKKDTLEQRIKQWLGKETYTSTLGRSSYNVKDLARKLGVTTHKIYSVLRNAEWCDAQEGYASTRYGDDRKYYCYRFKG